MIFEEEKHELDGKEIILRSAVPDEADMLVDYLKTVTGETPFLLCYPDEVKYTHNEEIKFIEDHNGSDSSMLLLAFVDGEYAGNCSFDGITVSRRAKHRASIGIGLFQKFTGFGLGRLLMERMLEKIQDCGFEQAELTVVSTNDRAYRLYESLGFREYGRIPNANKYDDGTYSDDIIMIKSL
ncbi:MAG: GNAT family N-acetyltransferase [Lachnospiraceae bacterium]|nr:GNAT family N-acetyltransferase [Lachnospiraceae bacterium]